MSPPPPGHPVNSATLGTPATTTVGVARGGRGGQGGCVGHPSHSGHWMLQLTPCPPLPGWPGWLYNLQYTSNDTKRIFTSVNSSLKLTKIIQHYNDTQLINLLHSYLSLFFTVIVTAILYLIHPKICPWGHL